MLSQSVNNNNNSSMNTSRTKQQIVHDRRNLRKDYRNLIHEAQANKSELIHPDSKGLLQLLERGDILYNKVDQPREAALDSEFLSLTSQYGLEQVQSLKIASSIDSQGFITRIKDILMGEESDPSPEGWLLLSAMVDKLSYTTPSFDFMYGPMSIEIKEKKKIVRKPKQVEDEIGKKVTAEQVQDTQANTTESETTSTRVQALKSFIERKKEVSLFDMIIDKKSFSKTIENIFYYSFLLKDGHTSLDKKLVVQPSKPPEEQHFKTGNAIPKHSIIKMDYEEWQRLVNISNQSFDAEEELSNLKRNRSNNSNSQKDPNNRPNKTPKNQ